MCTKLESFDQLSSAIKSADRADFSLIEILANPKTCEAKRKKAAKEVVQKAHYIMEKINSKFYVLGSQDIEIYNDYCRTLAAYILHDKKSRDIKETMLTLESLLEIISERMKPELRAVKKQIKTEGAKIEALGFTWPDITHTFQAESFARKYAVTKINVPAEPKVIIQTETIIEQVTVEKQVTKYVEVPVKDVDYFGPEDQYTEHKASFLVAPKDQKIQDQKKEICRKICGMLNADGGKLYIGVDNETFRTVDNSGVRGIENDLRILSSDRFGNHVNSIEKYVHYVKREIEAILKRSNADTSHLFIPECIVVDLTENCYVICVSIRPSAYCTVFLDGTAYRRSGDECFVMSEEEIILRNETRRHIGKEARLEEVIRKAIRDRKQVILRRYRSSNSNEISDRRVEPYALVCNNGSVMCYDIEKQGARQFKLSRIEEVTVLGCEWKYSSEHKETRTDVFEWTYTGQQYHIMLSMSLKAMSYFREIHKDSERLFSKCSDNQWILDATVYSLEPVVGFYLSMAKEISIIETEDSEALKKHISEYVYNYVLNCA